MSIHRARLMLVLVAALASAGLAAAGASAQQGPAGVFDPARDCQTVRVCQFKKGGSYRGCISAYPCRTCRPVAARCNVGDRTRKCYQLRCGWGA